MPERKPEPDVSRGEQVEYRTVEHEPPPSGKYHYGIDVGIGPDYTVEMEVTLGPGGKVLSTRRISPPADLAG